jgi:hypothetical protein
MEKMLTTVITVKRVKTWFQNVMGLTGLCVVEENGGVLILFDELAVLQCVQII